MVDLVSLMNSANIATRPLGVNISRKVKGKRSARLGLLLTVLWLDSIYTVLLAFIPTEQNEELLLKLGDFPYMIFDKKRYLFYAVVVFYRVSSAAMVTTFARSDFNWLIEANQLFNQLKTPSLVGKLIKLRSRCRVVTLLVICFRSVTIMIAATMIIVIKYQRNSNHFLVHTYLYLLYYAVLYTSVNQQFMIEIYFLCRICIEIFKEINFKFVYSVLEHQQCGHFSRYYADFERTCLLVHRVMTYVRPTYVIYFVCNLIVDIFVLFNGIFANNGPFFTSLLVAFSIGKLSVIVFFSWAIGHIDVKAKSISDLVYRLYVIDSYNPYSRSFKSKIQRYFQSVWSSTIGMKVLGNAINSTTSIRVLTVVLTVMAFLISNYRNA